MIEGVPPFAVYDPGADSDSNASRRQSVRAVTVHTTQGTDSRGLGKTRHHNTPGTFNFLVRLDGTTYCYYPAWVRCSHAAGSNSAGPGIELEGYTDDVPQPSAQLAALGVLARWLHDTYGVPLVLRPDSPRLYVDRSSWGGFVNHLGVDYPPDRSLLHFDRVTQDEWSEAVMASLDLRDLVAIRSIVNGMPTSDAPTLVSLNTKLDALLVKVDGLDASQGSWFRKLFPKRAVR